MFEANSQKGFAILRHSRLIGSSLRKLASYDIWVIHISFPAVVIYVVHV